MSVTNSSQGSAFAFPNPFMGLIAFSSLITIGVSILAGATFKRWFWRGLQLGALLGFGFVLWLVYQSLYVIGAICIYCMLTWAIMAPLVWYITLFNLREGHIPTSKRTRKSVKFMQKHHGDILIAWYVIITGLILHRFWYFFGSLI